MNITDIDDRKEGSSRLYLNTEDTGKNHLGELNPTLVAAVLAQHAIGNLQSRCGLSKMGAYASSPADAVENLACGATGGG